MNINKPADTSKLMDVKSMGMDINISKIINRPDYDTVTAGKKSPENLLRVRIRKETEANREILKQNAEIYNAYTGSYSEYMLKFNDLLAVHEDSLVFHFELGRGGLENAFMYYAEQGEAIENSQDKEHEKSMRLLALEDAFKYSVRWISAFRMINKYDFSVSEETGADSEKYGSQEKAFVAQQGAAVDYSIYRLAGNFLKFINETDLKASDDSFKETMMDYVNKDSLENGDVSNMSMSELDDFADYTNTPKFVHRGTKEDENIYRDYFNFCTGSAEIIKKVRLISDDWFSSHSETMKIIRQNANDRIIRLQP